jgi:hypothetical protein
MPWAVREFPGPSELREQSARRPLWQRNIQRLIRWLTALAGTDYLRRSRPVVADLTQQVADTRGPPVLVMTVKAQVAVAPLQRPCSGCRAEAESGQGNRVHPLPVLAVDRPRARRTSSLRARIRCPGRSPRRGNPSTAWPFVGQVRVIAGDSDLAAEALGAQRLGSLDAGLGHRPRALDSQPAAIGHG